MIYAAIWVFIIIKQSKAVLNTFTNSVAFSLANCISLRIDRQTNRTNFDNKLIDYVALLGIRLCRYIHIYSPGARKGPFKNCPSMENDEWENAENGKRVGENHLRTTRRN